MKTTASALTAIGDALVSPNESDRNGEVANVVDGLFAIARGLHAVAKSIERLGTAHASTDMGAIELLAMEVKDGTERLAGAIADARVVLP